MALAPFALLLLCAAAWALLIAPRTGARLAVTAVTTSAAVLVLIVMTVTAATGLPALPTLVTVVVVLGVVAAIMIRRAGAIRLDRGTLLPVLASGAGATAWLAVVAISPLVPGADTVSWAMSGDATNNLQQARAHLADNGLEVESAARVSVPMTSLLLSVAMAPGRPVSGESALLAHDLLALSAFWCLSLMIVSTLIGLVASSLMTRWRGLAAGSFSLLGASWFVAGLSLDSGYLNGLLAISLVLLGWLGYLGSDRSPALSLCVLLALSLIALATWSPVAIVTGALFLASASKHRNRINSLPRPVIAAVGALVAVMAAWAIAVVAPALAQNISAFRVEGHGFPSTIGILVAAAAAIAILGRTSAHRPGILAIISATAVGLAALVAFTGSFSDPITYYYPTKISWIMSSVLGVIALAFLLRVISIRATQRSILPSIAVTWIAATLLASVGPSPTRTSTDLTTPLAAILTGTAWNAGDSSAAIIVDRVGTNSVLYRTTQQDEAFINFWLIDFGAGGVGEDPLLRRFAVDGYRELRDTGEYTPPSIEELCSVAGLLGEDPIVVTSEDRAKRDIAAQCSIDGLRLVVE